jgi:hypothetical protein
MGENEDFPPRALSGKDPWNVRIHAYGGNDQVLGAGILLTEHLVLTCAHVIPRHPASEDPEPVRVAMVGTPDWHESAATVAPSGWVPRRMSAEFGGESRGDVALLELENAVPVQGAPLHRLAPHRGRRVHMLGFPSKVRHGIIVSAQLAGAAGEWVQLDPIGESGPRVVRGYSGAAVVDDRTGTVIGMVDAKHGDPTTGVSWMLPIDTIIGYLPQVAHLVGGEPATDQPLRQYRDTRLDESLVETVRELVDAVVRQGPQNLVIVVGDRGARRSRGLGILATRADPEVRATLRDGLVDPAQPGTMPPLASVDVALDATGRTVSQVIERITTRLGVRAGSAAEVIRQIGARHGRATVLVDSVDDSAEPDALLTELLIPLAEAGSTVLIGVRSQPAVTMNTPTRKLDLTGPPDTDDPVADRLRKLGELVDDAERAERSAKTWYEKVAPRVVGALPVVSRATALRLRVSGVRMALAKLGAAETEANQVKILATLDSCARAAERVRVQAEAAERVLTALLAGRDELRGRLDGYLAVAVADGHAEDPGLGDLFVVADQLLSTAPCDLAAAESAVNAYLSALWQRQGREPEEEKPC